MFNIFLYEVLSTNYYALGIELHIRRWYLLWSARIKGGDHTSYEVKKKALTSAITAVACEVVAGEVRKKTATYVQKTHE